MGSTGQGSNLTATNVTITSLDTTDDESLGSDGTTELIILKVLDILIGSCGILGNGVVIAVIFTNLKSFKSLTHLLIMHQSIIDFASSLVFTILRIDTWQPLLRIPGAAGEVFCRLWYSEYPLWALFMTSTLNLVLLSTERYLAVVHPVIHRNKLSRAKIKLSMGVIWVVGFTYQSYLAATNTRLDGACVWGWKEGTESLQTFVGVLTFFAEYFCPMCVICVQYLFIALKLRGLDRRRGENRRQNESSVSDSARPAPAPAPVVSTIAAGPNNKASGPSAADNKGGTGVNPREVRQHKENHFSRAFRNVIKTLLVVFLVNVICWTPTEFEYMIYNLGGNINFNGTVHKISVILVVCNMICNPFVYSMQYKEFQKGLRRTFGFMGARGNQVEDTVADTTMSVTDNR